MHMHIHSVPFESFHLHMRQCEKHLPHHLSRMPLETNTMPKNVAIRKSWLSSFFLLIFRLALFRHTIRFLCECVCVQVYLLFDLKPEITERKNRERKTPRKLLLLVKCFRCFYCKLKNVFECSNILTLLLALSFSHHEKVDKLILKDLRHCFHCRSQQTITTMYIYTQTRS